MNAISKHIRTVTINGRRYLAELTIDGIERAVSFGRHTAAESTVADLGRHDVDGRIIKLMGRYVVAINLEAR